jgi:thymidylate synthase
MNSVNSIKKTLPGSLYLNNIFKNPLEMFNSINELTKKSKVRNFCGVIENMNRDSIVVETDLFTKEILEFYSKHNMGLLDKAKDAEVYSKYYTELRGGSMGDYSDKFQDKFSNVVDALTKFPNTKRGIITMPYSNKKSHEVKHSEDSEYKCLRELHFYIEDGLLHCTGFMRAQAAIIFPKNIHFIGEVFNQVSEQINVPVGSYTHFVTTLVYDRE